MTTLNLAVPQVNLAERSNSIHSNSSKGVSVFQISMITNIHTYQRQTDNQNEFDFSIVMSTERIRHTNTVTHMRTARTRTRIPRRRSQI